MSAPLSALQKKVTPEPMSFWGHERIGSFSPPEENGIGLVHLAPANDLNKSWCKFIEEAQLGIYLAPRAPNIAKKVGLNVLVFHASRVKISFSLASAGECLTPPMLTPG